MQEFRVCCCINYILKYNQIVRAEYDSHKIKNFFIGCITVKMYSKAVNSPICLMKYRIHMHLFPAPNNDTIVISTEDRRKNV